MLGSFIFLTLQSFNQGFTCPITFAQLASQFLQNLLLFFSFTQLNSLNLQIVRELVQHSLQKLAAQKTFSSPSPFQFHLFEVKIICCEVIDYQMDSFLFDLFIKKSLIKALHKDINGLIGKLYAADEILTLFDSCLFDWRIVLNVSDREISVKNLIIPLFPKRQANRIVIS